MQKQFNAVNVRIGVKMIDAGSVKRARSAYDPMHFVIFLKQEIGKITAVLPGYTRNQCPRHRASGLIHVPEHGN